MAVVRTHLEAKGEGVELACVLTAVAQRGVRQVQQSRTQAAHEADTGFGAVPDMVLACGQEVSGVCRGLQPVGMFRVVASPGGAAEGLQGRIEVIARAVLAPTRRDQPRQIGIQPYRAAPSLHLDLEQHLVVHGPDAFVLAVLVRELLGRLDQHRVVDLVQRHRERRHREAQILA
ncbi:hypothetical protein ABZ016_03315 [Streptomyces sp. NPDC006372]|uniref:hypothetical protein n=1 Tax=Streptomyces sp. NPDC006372 TaxID=3155599 RepID=UPI0033A2F7E1